MTLLCPRVAGLRLRLRWPPSLLAVAVLSGSPVLSQDELKTDTPAGAEEQAAPVNAPLTPITGGQLSVTAVRRKDEGGVDRPVVDSFAPPRWQH